ncbi:unnamed protein product, partial [Closterium sp. NIES-54]
MLFMCPSLVHVDITLVHQEVDRTIGVIRLRYVEYVDIFGGGVSVRGPLSEGLGFESQYMHFGHPSAGGCQRSTGDPRLILGKGYRLVVLEGYGRTDPLLNKPFYPNGLVVGNLTVSKLLSSFIARLGSGRRTIRVDGTDADGEPSSHQIVLSEAPIAGHQYGGSMTDCIKMCKAFALEVATNMHTRMWSLKQMDDSKLYKVETWPEATDKRDRRVLSWLDANARLFNNRLP